MELKLSRNLLKGCGKMQPTESPSALGRKMASLCVLRANKTKREDVKENEKNGERM